MFSKKAEAAVEQLAGGGTVARLESDLSPT
jgi:hypothetical protein